jgi:hypothetical protein
MLIADCIPTTSLHAFTIGTFDGVHLGHQALIQKLKATGKPTAVLTFSAHPLKTLKPEIAPLLITPLPIKLMLLKEQGIALTIAIPFSAKFATTSFSQLLASLPLSHLILGEGSAFGYNREGSEKNVLLWGKENHVSIEYLEKTIPASSQKIREAIVTGDLALAEQLLGRPHLLYVPANTTRFSVVGLAMPPDGNYLLSTHAEPPPPMDHTFARMVSPRSHSGPKFVGNIKAGWAHLSTSFPEPTILSFNLSAAISPRQETPDIDPKSRASWLDPLAVVRCNPRESHDI